MKNGIRSIFIVINIMFSSMLSALPNSSNNGTNPNSPDYYLQDYTCPAYRTTDCQLNGTTTAGGTINQACVTYDPDITYTQFGDSLSDLVDVYGITTAQQLSHVYSLNGYEAKSEIFYVLPLYQGLIANFSDYYTKYWGYPVTVQNLGLSTITSDVLVNHVTKGDNRCNPVGYSVYNNLVDGHPAIPVPINQTSTRSVVMIGGNDRMFSMTVAFPFMSQYVVNNSSYNIEKFVDWNLENGKSVLLLGNIPINALGLKSYGDWAVSRQALCEGGPGNIIPFIWEQAQKIPWWVWMIPGAPQAIATYVQDLVQDYYNAWGFFMKDVFSDIMEGTLITASISQACLNDRIANDLVPKYKAVPAYSKRIEVLPMYDSFNVDPSVNFWVPKQEYYFKNMFVSTGVNRGFLQINNPNFSKSGFSLPSLSNSPYIERDKQLDVIHIGPLGYKQWTSIVTNHMSNNGWDKQAEPYPAIDPRLLTADGKVPDPQAPGFQCDLGCLVVICIALGECSYKGAFL